MSRLHPIFNVVKLSLAPLDPVPGRRTSLPPLPEIVDGEEEWVVEKILDSRMVNQRLRYLVKWEGFSVEHNSWEPWDNVHVPDLVADFCWRHPGAARHIRMSTSAPFLSIQCRVITALKGEWMLGHRLLALLLTIYRPLSTGHCAQYR